MPRVKRDGGEPHYYSNQLRRKLNSLLSTSAAVVEAPSGYGKTTAVRDTLESHVPRGIPVYWFTAADETPVAGFRRLCRAIDEIDSQAGQRLLKIELPNAATVGEAGDALRALQCPNQAYLVIDNFQLLSDYLLPPFFTALLEHGGEGLHIIVITQMLRRNIVAYMEGHGILHLNAVDLRLSAADIARYYAGTGVAISPEDAERVARSTEGWIAAVYLHLCAFRERGTFFDTCGILTLMEHLVWDVLSAVQQDFLLRLSPFDVFTGPQACELGGWKMLPVYAEEALKNPFINYEPAERRYELHSILSELLAKKRGERGEVFERECLLRAGDFCRSQGKTLTALGFYAQINDYESMLSLDLSHIILEDIGSNPFAELALVIARECPPDIKKRHILSMLRIAWALVTAGLKTPFACLMEEMREMIEAVGWEQTSYLLGEWTLLSSFLVYPHLEKMTVIIKEAEVLLDGRCSQVILPSAPWCFGEFSTIAIFHLQPGEADREVDALEEYIAIYSRLTNGQGSGANVLFRAYLAYYRGDLDEAEILSYKAAFVAESRQQSIVQLGCAYLLGEIAVNKADTAGWQGAISFMERAASFGAQYSFTVRSAVDHVRGVLFNTLTRPLSVADWLQKGDFSGRRLLPTMSIDAYFVHLSYLMHRKEFARLIGTAEAVLTEDAVKAPLFQALVMMVMAVAYKSMGYPEKSLKLVEQAADLVLPDRMIFLIAAYSYSLQDLPDQVVEKRYPQLLDRYLVVKERFISGAFTLYADMFAGQLPSGLTDREYEVARLAAAGLRNSEIAEKLMVTENTIRFHLRAIFQKLDIDRRARLAEKLR